MAFFSLVLKPSGEDRLECTVTEVIRATLRVRMWEASLKQLSVVEGGGCAGARHCISALGTGSK